MDNDKQQKAISDDHDLLIRLDTKFDNLDKKFDDLSENIVARVVTLEKDSIKLGSAAKDIRNDFEGFRNGSFKDVATDVKVISRYLWMGLGILGFIQFILVAYLMWRQIHPLT